MPDASQRKATVSRGADRLRPRFLVLLASHDGAATIERQIASVLAQEHVDVRIDVRDDGSTDDTTERVERLGSCDARVRLRPDRAASGSAAGNFFELIRHARTDDVDYVAFCDQDDEWFPHKLHRAAEMLAGTGARGCSSAVCAVWPGGRESVLTQSVKVSRADHLFEGFGQGCTFVLDVDWFECLRKRLERSAPLLKGVHYHDWLVYALTRAAGGRWAFDPRPSMRYHQHGGNDTGARISLAGIVRRLGRLRDGWYRRQVDAIAAVVLDAHPSHAPAIRWQKVTAPRSRPARFLFVACHGRRRLSDRLIQTVAVGLGYL